MDALFLDIETIPNQSPDALDEIRSSITPPGNIKKLESIKAWMDENAESAAEEKWLKTALNGSSGEIVCISWAFKDSEVRSVFRALGELEVTLLEEFYAAVAMQLPLDQYKAFTRVIHGSKDLFDLRFLYQRSVICGTKPSFDLCQDHRYNGDTVFDTMTAWAGWGNYCSLDSVCSALGIQSPKGDMDGSKVWETVKAGDIAKVVNYNKADVEALRNVYYRLSFKQAA